MKVVIKNQGIALVAAIVVTLIVSLVAVAIASTAVANRHLSNSDYEVNSSYVNAQAGLNIAETILQTSSGDELKANTQTFATGDGALETKIAMQLSDDCNDSSITIDSANNCFWWIGRTISSPYDESPFLTKLSASQGSNKTSYLNDDNSEIQFKLEKRPEFALASLGLADTLGKTFYRVTSIAKGNGNNQGIIKVQGQLQVFAEVDKDISVSEPDETKDYGSLDVKPSE